jgi:hypothetical protein
MGQSWRFQCQRRKGAHGNQHIDYQEKRRDYESGRRYHVLSALQQKVASPVNSAVIAPKRIFDHFAQI